MSEAGLFAGTVTTSAPADGAVTDKPKGYHWFEYAEPVIEDEDEDE